MRILTQWMLCLCALASMAGCAGQTYYSDPQQSQAMTFPNTNTPQTMRMAEKILGQMHFTIRQMDFSTGTLATNPLSGAQFFEFWRKDAVNCKSLTDSSLHTLRRSVTLEFTEQDAGTMVTCHVLTERLSVPSREVAGQSSAYGILTESSPSRPTMKLSTEQKNQMAWVSLGYDPDLAQSILYHIETELTEMTTSE
jgi:hypothetical protein